MNFSRIVVVAVACTLIVLIVASCTATQPHIVSFVKCGPGFWKGLWHGFIAPISFIVSLFSDHLRIYAYPNAGKWYDFGFMLGIGGFSGGIFAGLKNQRRGK
jgi:hypothetical protein